MKQAETLNSLIASIEEIETIRKEWIEIYEGNAVKHHFLSFDFIKIWYSCFAAPNNIRIYRIGHNGITIGFLPLVIINENGIRTLKSLTNFHCMHSGPLVRDGMMHIFTEKIIYEIHLRRCEWDMFSAQYIYSFDKNLDMFTDCELLKNGYLLKKSTEVTYLTLLDQDYDVYIKSLSKSVRKNIRLWNNRLRDAGESRFVCYQGFEAVSHWPELLKLEDSGWKGAKGSSLMRIARNYQDYYDELIDMLGKSGALRMYFLELNGETIAGGIGYIENDTLHWWKSGFEVTYSDLSPSNQLFLFIVSHLRSNNPQIKKIHLFTGDFGYKHRYCNIEAYCSEILIYNKTLRGLGAYYWSEIKRIAKKNHFISRTFESYRSYIKNKL